MEYTFDKEKILQVAKEMGLDARFGSETPGIKNKETGKITDFSTVMTLFIDVDQTGYDQFVYQGTINLGKVAEEKPLNKDFNIPRAETQNFKYEEVVEDAIVKKQKATRFENITCSNFQFTEGCSVA